MSGIIITLYALLILVYLAIGAAIVFHIIHYRINRKVATVMVVIYLVGSIIFLISNYSFFIAIDWYRIFSNFSL